MKPTTRKALALLEDNESVTSRDFVLAGVGFRYSARIHELRQEGYVIAEQRLTDGRSGSRYRLIATPESEAA